MTEIELYKMTDSELIKYVNELKDKFGKLRKLANKVAKEMDDLSDEYNTIKEIATDRGIEV